MAQGFVRVTTATVITGASVTTAIQLGAYKRVSLMLPTFSAGINTNSASVRVLVASASGSTYRNLTAMGVYSNTSGIATWEIPDGQGKQYVPCNQLTNFPGYFMKIELIGANVTGTAGIECQVHQFN